MFHDSAAFHFISTLLMHTGIVNICEQEQANYKFALELPVFTRVEQQTIALNGRVK
jgi:hypothetical protein